MVLRRSHSKRSTRSRRPARWAWILFLSLGLTRATVAAPAPPSDAAHVVDRIIAVVNNEVIMLSELKTEVAGEEKRLGERYRGADLKRRLQQTEYSGLTRMIERKLQIQLAQKKGVDVSEEEIKRAVQELRRQGEKIDEDNPKDHQSIREQLTLLKVVDREVRGNVLVSESEFQRYYDQHQSRFTLPQEYRISQILLQQKASEDRPEFRKRAAAIHAQLKQGDDFADLALRFSDGAEATRGGSLGFIRQGELLPQIERALASLQPGQFTEPVESPQGLHIIRLEETKPAQFRPYAEVKNEIRGMVYQQKTEDVYQVWMTELKNKAYIEVKF